MRWQSAEQYNGVGLRMETISLYMFSCGRYNSYKGSVWVLLADKDGEYRFCMEGVRATTWAKMTPIPVPTLEEAKKYVEVVTRLQLGESA